MFDAAAETAFKELIVSSMSAGVILAKNIQILSVTTISTPSQVNFSVYESLSQSRTGTQNLRRHNSHRNLALLNTITRVGYSVKAVVPKRQYADSSTFATAMKQSVNDTFTQASVGSDFISLSRKYGSTHFNDTAEALFILPQFDDGFAIDEVKTAAPTLAPTPQDETFTIIDSAEVVGRKYWYYYVPGILVLLFILCCICRFWSAKYAAEKTESHESYLHSDEELASTAFVGEPIGIMMKMIQVTENLHLLCDHWKLIERTMRSGQPLAARNY